MGKNLVNRHGRVIEREVEALRASDLLKLMEVVKEATGLYNVLERVGITDEEVREEFDNLGAALRELGLIEVQP